MINFKNSTFIKSTPSVKERPLDQFPEVLIVGKSNVGKSSLINSLCQRKALAFTSSKPGHTRLLNYYNIDNKFFLVDAPGYGYAKVSKKVTDDWGPMMETFLANRDNLKVVVQLVDIRHEPTAQDVQMYEYLRHYGLSGIVVATKADKLKRSQIGKSLSVIKKTLDLTEEDIIIPVSALKREGADKVMDFIEQLVLEG